jgi:hypothetical protein
VLFEKNCDNRKTGAEYAPFFVCRSCWSNMLSNEGGRLGKMSDICACGLTSGLMRGCD